MATNSIGLGVVRESSEVCTPSTTLIRKPLGRKTAARRLALDVCVMCGADARHRHHINSDTQDNCPANLAGLCIPCHQLAHGILKVRASASWRNARNLR